MSIYEDNPARNLIEDARVWVNGIEVTSRLNSSVSVTQVGRGGYNTAQFSLSNASDGFVLNERNLDETLPMNERFLTGGPSGEHSEAIKKAMYLYKKDEGRNPVEPLTGERRWPLNQYSSILSALDLVFIAERWPYSKEPLYIPRFKGYIESKPATEDFITGRSAITISCFGIRAILSRMRLQMNYIIMNVLAGVSASGDGTVTGTTDRLNSLDPVVQDGFFADMQNPNQWTTPLAGLSLKDTIEFLITGTVTETDEIQVPGFSSRIRARTVANIRDDLSSKGVGQMSLGLVVSYPNGDGESPNDIRILEEWHRLCLFGVPDRSDGSPDSEVSSEEEQAASEVNKQLTEEEAEELGLTDGQRQLFGYNSRPWSAEEVENHGRNCTWEGNTSPHAMNLHFLLPSTGSGMNGVTSFTQDQGSTERRWQSRLSIIEEYLENLDYHWFVTGAGDIVVEFPMYDFTPERFGEFEQAFTIRHDGEGKSITFDDDRPNVPACIIATSGYNKNVEEAGQLENATLPNSNEASVLRTVVFAPIVASRIGMNIERISLPFALDDVCRLRQFAVLKFQRKLAEANILTVDFIYRPLFTPNRPLLETRRNRMGWISQTTSGVPPATMEYGQANTGIVLKYIRRPNEEGEYRLITGSATMPLSYTGRGPAMNATRGILIDESTSIDRLTGGGDPCSGSTVGAPPPDYGQLDNAIGIVFDEEANESCSKDPSDLAADVRALWEQLRNEANDQFALTVELTCTYRPPVVETNEPFDPDLHAIYPARAFDVSVSRWDGSEGTAEDYTIVGNLGVSMGLRWGGDVPSSPNGRNIETIQSLIRERLQFHVSNSSVTYRDGRTGTPYIWGGSFTTREGPPGSLGVDCSGLVYDCYKYAGLIERDDRLLSFQLQKKYPSTDSPRFGDMIFMGKTSTTHVAIVDSVDSQGRVTIYGASGGGPNCTTVQYAGSHNARVKYLRNYYPDLRSDFQGFGTPFEDLSSNTPFLAHFYLP